MFRALRRLLCQANSFLTKITIEDESFVFYCTSEASYLTVSE